MSLTEFVRRWYAAAADALSGTTSYPESVGRYPRRLQGWLMLSGNRRHVAFLLLVGVYAVLLVAGLLWPFEIQRLLTEEQTVQQLLNTLLSGVILLVSIVVSINSLVLSEELAPVEKQYQRVVDSWEFRTESAEAVGNAVSSASPTEFLLEMLDAVEDELYELSARMDHVDAEPNDQLRNCIEDIEAYVGETRELLESARFRSSDMRLFAPSYDPVTELDTVRQLHRKESLPDEVTGSLNTVVEGLEFFTSAREYFKTMYYKREFARLSRDLLYTGLPAVMLMSYLTLALTGQVLPGTTFGVSHLYLFFSFAYVVSLSPFFVLAAYVLRAAVIAEATITAGGFILE